MYGVVLQLYLYMTFQQKCTTIHISKKRNPIHTGYKLHGHTLESVPGSKYLGVHVNKDLSWNDHIQQTSAKTSRSVGFLRRYLRGCPQDVKAQAYTTLVQPVLQFGICTRSNRSTHWNGYNDKPPDLSPVIIPAETQDLLPECCNNYNGTH